MSRVFSFVTTSICLMLVALAPAQSIGPDVIVGDLTGPNNYAALGGIKGYSLGTTSCNVGDTPLLWIQSTNQHPVIGQNLYRIHEGRFEQVGISWLKHGFTALQQTVCGPCTAHPNGTALGVGCSDPYTAGLNGTQTRLGPRSEVNAATAFFAFPFCGTIACGTANSTSINRRGQVLLSDLDPANFPGAVYFAEGQYISPDDTAAGNGLNNVSYRRISVGSGPAFDLDYTGSTQRERPAIQAWQDLDPSVDLFTVDIPNDGRMILGHKFISLGNGLNRHEYALYNMNSDRSGYSVQFHLPNGATTSNTYFRDVPYHSGEPYNSIDWVANHVGNVLSFSCTETFAQNQDANALRWGTVYTFSFESNASPTLVQIGLFKPGSPNVVDVPVPFGLYFSTSGGGTGGALLGLINVPTGTTHGYTAFSLNTVGLPGSGPLFGLDPDYLTLFTFFQPPAPGNLFHWLWPVSAVYPLVPLDFPVGTFPFPSGLTMDAMAVALDGAGAVTGTKVSRATW